MEKLSILSSQVIHAAYTQGYFPMPDPVSNEIQWYRPDPRAVIPLDCFHVSRSLQRILKKNIYNVSYNQSFEAVMRGCSNRSETWINEEFIQSYCKLHRLGAAQSVETWLDGKLAGGIYGVNFGGVFFAESMFHNANNASKVALYFLVEKLKKNNFIILECQFMTDHLKSMGAEEISDSEYMKIYKSS